MGVGPRAGEPTRPSCTSESPGDLSRSHALSHPRADKEGLADPEGRFRGPWVPASPARSTGHWEAEGGLPGGACAGGLRTSRGSRAGDTRALQRRGARGPQAQETAGSRVGAGRLQGRVGMSPSAQHPPPVTLAPGTSGEHRTARNPHSGWHTGRGTQGGGRSGGANPSSPAWAPCQP